MNKKKILLLAQLPPPTHGASTMNKLVLESQTIRANFDCKVIPLQFETNLPDLGRFSFKKVYKLFRYSTQIFLTLLTKRYQIVYYSLAPVGNALFKDVLIVSIIKIFRVEIVHHLHVKGISKDMKANRLSERLYKFLFRGTNVICLSTKLSSEVVGMCKAVFIVPNGIPDAAGEFQRGNTKMPHILFLSNFIRSKGICTFLESLLLLHKENKDFRAVIVGGPADVTADEIENFIFSNGLNNKVEQLGPKYGVEKLHELRSAEIFVFPTFYKGEAFPLVLLEAMQFGLAVISTFEGAISEIVDDGKTGFLVLANDPHELSAKLDVLLKDNSLRQHMAINARAKFRRKYTLEIFEASLIDVFNQVSA